MKFRLTLKQKLGNKIPFNYQYPMSSAIYKIIQKADEEYATQLHKVGFGKGFKFFTFSELKFQKFNWDKDGIIINDEEKIQLYIDIYLPKTAKSLIKGIFEHKNLFIADKHHKTDFSIDAVEIMDDPLQNKKEDELLSVKITPTSPIVIGRKNERGNYDYLSPTDTDFEKFLLKNWVEKIKTFNPASPPHFIEVKISKAEKAKSKLITMKAETPQETKIKGFSHFEIELFGRKKDIDLIVSGGVGLYNAQGMGSVKITEIQ